MESLKEVNIHFIGRVNQPCENEEVRKWGSEEVRKWGSEEVRKWGNEEVRKWGNEEADLAQQDKTAQRPNAINY